MTREHLADELGVEGRGGLVEEHQLRVHRQGPGDGDPLLLAAGELGRVGVRLVAQADLLEQLERACRAPAFFSTPLTCTGASMTFSSAVMCGKRLNRWKTMPMSRRWAAICLSVRRCSVPPCGRA